MKRIILVGKPNSGKTLLFNQLTGLKQKVANFPGVTVELKSGQFAGYQVVDFPGAYSLHTLSKDEQIAVEKLHEALLDDNTALIVCNLDATRLESSLVFGLQVQRLAKQHNKALIFALNMIDELGRFGHHIDTDALSRQLGSPVYAISARTLEGIAEFKTALQQDAAAASAIPELSDLRPDAASDLKQARQLAAEHGIKDTVVLKNQNRIDSFMLNSISGSVMFLLVMFFLFQSIFTFATPLMDAVESIIAYIAEVLTEALGPGVIHDFINDAVFGGLGSFLVFVPQIMVLTLIIGLLEDSGYLARAALICHRPLSYFGLSGRSFIPYLSAHACAIPAIMAARTIESPRKRLITMLTIPLMSCSARLPVYALLIAVFIPDIQYLGGLVNLQGIAFFALYFMGILTALMISLLLSRSDKIEPTATDMPFILELPTYRLPHWKPLLQRVLQSGKHFIYRAGPVIFMVSVVIWVLSYFPAGGDDLAHSYLGTIGHFIEPIFEPLGLDWRYGVAILLSFLAREVFVGALGTLFGVSNADENVAGLAENIQQDGLALGAGLGILLFYVVALQCVATVATLKAETGNNKLVIGVVVAYGLLAYLLAAITYHLIG
ncbi:ferrous iron transporter B [Rheinheimera aquimaris]|jgi:ferrous iron transport protein B|uniref:ferrous iron transporter B n=1 Tax=Rheinheimera aquimaris TaxID=412437 RepID=UPI000E92F20D|nr:ferrous iron transporter B [Rheinheimera aquimaris]HBN87939.1 ferrous iron transporter B [Rheinheimera sp.]|tara:strand:+ start:1631 stop:3454 length:1824 start_codon:yes stop_codon:yes gene_type:complete